MVRYIDCEGLACKIHNETIDMLRGEHPALLVAKPLGRMSKSDKLYLRGIKYDAGKLGIRVIDYLTAPPMIDGVLYLGRGWDAKRYLRLDVDGVGADSALPMSVVSATMMLADLTYSTAYNLKAVGVRGEKALVIGRGRVGRQVAQEFLKRDAMVTIAHSAIDVETIRHEAAASDIIVNAGMSGAAFELPKTKLVVDLTGAENQYEPINGNDFYLTPRVKGIGLVTRAVLLNRVAKHYLTGEYA